MLGGSAEGHIAVLPPVLLMKADVREKIDGRFEHIELIGFANPVEAVSRIAALDVAAIAFAGGIDAPLVPVTGNAVFIISDLNCKLKCNPSDSRLNNYSKIKYLSQVVAP